MHSKMPKVEIAYETGRRVGITHVETIEAFEIKGEKERQALEFILEKHGSQKRLDGSLYVSHLVAVASIVRGLGVEDQDVVSAALLHDVVEDTEVTLEQVEAHFGARVARLVDGVSKFKTPNGVESDFETLRKVVQTSYLEPEVGLIKLADRLHNMRTLRSMSPEKQMAKAKETLNVYTGLAEAYGLWVVKTELEDIAFQYLNPEHFELVKKQIDSDPRLSPEFLEYHKSVLQEVLRDLGVEGQVVVRLKGYYEADKKRNRAARRGLVSSNDFRDITDIVSFRVVLSEHQPAYFRLKQSTLCHLVLGELYEAFANNVDSSGYSDYITKPQLNGYRALQSAIQSDLGPF